MIIYINAYVPTLSDFDDGFNYGARAGMFDACGGRDVRDFSDVSETDWNAGYVAGYAHAFAAFC